MQQGQYSDENLETAPLYKINSRLYIKDAYETINNKTPKTLQEFETLFKSRFTKKAQKRQNLLKNKVQNFNFNYINTSGKSKSPEIQNESATKIALDMLIKAFKESESKDGSKDDKSTAFAQCINTPENIKIRERAYKERKKNLYIGYQDVSHDSSTKIALEMLIKAFDESKDKDDKIGSFAAYINTPENRRIQENADKRMEQLLYND